MYPCVSKKNLPLRKLEAKISAFLACCVYIRYQISVSFWFLIDIGFYGDKFSAIGNQSKRNNFPEMNYDIFSHHRAPEKALDGNISIHSFTLTSKQEVANGHIPWILIDLESTYDLSHLVIYQRSANGLHNVDVRLIYLLLEYILLDKYYVMSSSTNKQC